MISCPSCGYGLRFDIEKQQMYCESCGNYFSMDRISENSNENEAHQSQFECYTYVCPSCGAEIITTDKNDAVGFCQYCGGSAMIFEKIRQEWKPDHIIPFQITKEQCKELYCKEVKRQLFVSSKYRKAELIESFRGIYMPYWDYHGLISGTFKIGTVSPRQNIDSSTYQIIHYQVIGNTNFTLSGFSHDASSSFDDDISESLAPYDYQKQKPFSSGYLSGFYAETGNVSPHEYDSIVHAQIAENAEDILKRDNQIKNYLTNNSLKIESSNTQIPVKINSVTRSLNPVWFMSYRNGKTITYATVNGQTGKVVADLPLSPLRILAFAFGISAALFGIMCYFMAVIPSIKANVTLAVCLILMSAGMYYLQNSFNRTVDKPKNTSKRFRGKSRTTKPYTFALIILILSAITFVSDASYDRVVRSFVIFPLAISGIFIAVCHITLLFDTIKVRKTCVENNSPLRLHIVQDAKKFLNILIIPKIIMYLSIGIGILIAIADVPFNWISYGMCFIVALELFILALCHIYFQTQVAKRPLPQFNKRGAYYDEH